MMRSAVKVLFFVEGNTDIRFVTGLSEICCLTMAVPATAYSQSGLKERLQASGASLHVDLVPGGRLRFQLSSLLYLVRNARDFELVLCQEVLRGAFSCTLAGAISHTPVITYMGISPLEYFRCRRERRQIGAWKAWAGESLIRFLMSFNGRLATKCLAMGDYLREVSLPYCPRTESALYYGVDTEIYRPVGECEKIALRRKRGLPLDKFIIFLSSRISHEKDPETVLRATALARDNGLDAVAINLGGGYRDFLDLAKSLFGEQAADWVLGRPAAHPMIDLPEYYQASDCLAQASLAEGLGISPMEALACGIPVVCTAVGGLVHLGEFARLTPRSDAKEMSKEFLWIASHPGEARDQAQRGGEYVAREWNRKKAFADLALSIEQTVQQSRRSVGEPA
jgi:glycosyltransferase involved in cell wall biosynthesis